MKILKTDKRLIDEGYTYKVEGNLITDESLDLTDLDKGLYVTGYIKAGWYIEAGGSIEAGEYIEAGEHIKSGGYIEAGGCSGIVAGLGIAAPGAIKCGLKIFAGVCPWRSIDEIERTITCTELVGCGVVEYGTLNITEKPKKTVTLELTEEQLGKIQEIINN